MDARSIQKGIEKTMETRRAPRWQKSRSKTPRGAAGEPGAAVVGGDGGATDGGGCDWVQTGDEIELTFPVPEGATKKNVRCAFKPDRLDLSFEGHEGAGLKGDLGGLIDIDGCGWTIGEGKIVVTMEKKVPDVEWGFALKKD